jgi:CubicO group peptidase (beta-lactamase class C family)
MTKVFTSLVLMDMVRRGEVALTDPISKYLPESAKVPERNGRKITLADLSTQSSSLPRMPDNFTPKDPDNPYADHTVQQMYDFLSGCSRATSAPSTSIPTWASACSAMCCRCVRE